MSVLVTGGAGFIGSRIARALLDAGEEVDVADDLSTGRREQVPAGAAFFQVDLGREEGLRGLPARRWTAILHLAGQSSGEASFDDPLRDFDANARSTLLLARLALERGVPTLVHASSMGVYGEPDACPVDEAAPTRPRSWYGASKLAAERALAVAAEQGLRAASLRMFNVYGPGQDLTHPKKGLVAIFLGQLLRGEPLLVKGSLQRVRDLVHVDDVVRAWLLALERPARGALNIGGGRAVTVRELLDALLAACGLPADHPVEVAGATPGDTRAAVADIRAARDALGWTPRVDLRAGLAAAVARAREGRP